MRGATEGINLVAQSWGRRNVDAGDEIVITQLEHHANIVPWQQLCAEKGARLRVAPVDDRGQVILEEYEKLLGPQHAARRRSRRCRTRSARSRRRSEMVEMAHRHGARVLVDGAQAVSHMPRRRAGARLRLLRVLRAQGVRPDRHRRAVRQARACSRRCRRGRAAAT